MTKKQSIPCLLRLFVAIEAYKWIVSSRDGPVETMLTGI